MRICDVLRWYATEVPPGHSAFSWVFQEPSSSPPLEPRSEASIIQNQVASNPEDDDIVAEADPDMHQHEAEESDDQVQEVAEAPARTSTTFADGEAADDGEGASDAQPHTIRDPFESDFDDEGFNSNAEWSSDDVHSSDLDGDMQPYPCIQKPVFTPPPQRDPLCSDPHSTADVDCKNSVLRSVASEIDVRAWICESCQAINS